MANRAQIPTKSSALIAMIADEGRETNVTRDEEAEMEGQKARSDIQSLLQGIKSSKALESRITLLNQLGDVDISGNSCLALCAESLTFWEESTCSGVSQCTLNTSILHLAAKYLELDTTSCLSHFLILGTKASIWCGKHLQMTSMSIEESQEENHARLFSQLVLDSLSFSSAIFSALINSPMFGEKELMLIVESFVLEQFNLTKASIVEIKRFRSIASEVLKVTQVVLDAAIRLCRAYAQAIKWGSTLGIGNGDESLMADGGRVSNMTHVINITTCTIENLYELGILAASGGGSLVMILNISWKGVVTLLHLGKGVLADKINIGDIILSLIFLATESLRCAAEAWSSSTFRETLAVTEAKRTFLPIKFYLINAVRICSQYPCKALTVYKEIVLCVLMISTFGISLTKESHLKAASEVLAEFLEPTSFLLLLTLLNSDDVKQESKLQILDWLFTYESHPSSTHPEEISIVTGSTISLFEILTVTCSDMPRARTLMLGRFVLFLNIIKVAPDLKEEVVFGISTKLERLFEILTNEEIYSSILVLKIPVLCGSGTTTTELVWNPLFPFILHSLKTFMIVAALSPAWGEVESFLFANFLHPHFLCWEIIMELWCFLMRHAETEMINDFIDKLLSLFRMMASSVPALLPGCSLRKMARSICMLLSYAAPSTIDRLYTSIFSDDKSHLSSIMYTALLLEGFPLNSLSDSLRKVANQRTLDTFFGFIENDIKKVGVDSSWRCCSSGVLGVVPMYALSSVLRSPSSFDIDEKNISQLLKFAVAVIHSCQNATNSSNRDQLSELLGQILEIISNANNLFAPDRMEEVILELHNLFVAGPSASETWLYQCKPALASFLAGLSRMQMAEGEGSATCSAVWELYHMLLRERHWTFVHLALTAFEYFAARTSCDQLWRFVPSDAALSYDIETGNEAIEDRFMSEFKGFLEKEAALLEITPCSKQLNLLEKEGLVLKKTIGKYSTIAPEVSEHEIVEIDVDNQAKKKRKLPDGINEGMALLQSGLKTMGDGLARWKQQNEDSKELQDEFSTQFLCLEGVISHLVGLADSG